MGVILAMLAVPGLGLLLAMAQQSWYRWQLARGRVVEDDVPFFGILLLRGMMITLVLGMALAVLARLA